MFVLESLFLIDKTPEISLDINLKIGASIGKKPNLRCLFLLDQKIVWSQYKGTTFFLFFFQTDHAGLLIEVYLIKALLDKLDLSLSNNVHSVRPAPLLGDHVTLDIVIAWRKLVHQALKFFDLPISEVWDLFDETNILLHLGLVVLFQKPFISFCIDHSKKAIGHCPYSTCSRLPVEQW